MEGDCIFGFNTPSYLGKKLTLIFEVVRIPQIWEILCAKNINRLENDRNNLTVFDNKLYVL